VQRTSQKAVLDTALVLDYVCHGALVERG